MRIGAFDASYEESSNAEGGRVTNKSLELPQRGGGGLMQRSGWRSEIDRKTRPDIKPNTRTHRTKSVHR